MLNGRKKTTLFQYSLTKNKTDPELTRQMINDDLFGYRVHRVSYVIIVSTLRYPSHIFYKTFQKHSRVLFRLFIYIFYLLWQ